MIGFDPGAGSLEGGGGAPHATPESRIEAEKTTPIPRGAVILILLLSAIAARRKARRFVLNRRSPGYLPPLRALTTCSIRGAARGQLAPLKSGESRRRTTPAPDHKGTAAAIAAAIHTTPSNRPSRSIHDRSARHRPASASKSQTAPT